MCFTSLYPPKNVALNTVVENWLTPPPNASKKPSSVANAGASTKPRSGERGPIASFSENVWPGSTTVPFTRSHARWILAHARLAGGVIGREGRHHLGDVQPLCPIGVARRLLLHHRRRHLPLTGEDRGRRGPARSTTRPAVDGTIMTIGPDHVKRASTGAASNPASDGVRYVVQLRGVDAELEGAPFRRRSHRRPELVG